MSSAWASSSADGDPAPDGAGLPYVTGALLSELVSMADAIAAIEGALRQPALDQADRSVVAVESGELLLMPAQSARYVGTKIASVAPANPGRGRKRIQGVYLLMDAVTLTPLALLDGVALTALRTPAVSAVASAALAVPEAAGMVVFGAGPQAYGHVVAMCTIRPVRRVRVIGRTPRAVTALVDRITELGIDAAPAGVDAVRDADIVCTCTTAREPLFGADLLAEHAHIVAVGSHEPTAREIDARTVAACQIVVEDRATALREAGDLILAMGEDAVGAQDLLADLRELVAGAPVDPYARSLFKSVGMAWEDLAVASLACERLSAGTP